MTDLIIFNQKSMKQASLSCQELKQNYLTKIKNEHEYELKSMDQSDSDDRLYNFEQVKFNFDRYFYGENGNETDRTKMTLERILAASNHENHENFEWMNDTQFLNVSNGQFEWKIPEDGIYKFELESRSSNWSHLPDGVGGQVSGIKIKFRKKLEGGQSMFFFISDSIFLFDHDKELLAVPGSSGFQGGESSSGSITTGRINSDLFKKPTVYTAYEPTDVLNGTNRSYCNGGSGFTRGNSRVWIRGFAHYEGGTSFARGDLNAKISNVKTSTTRHDTKFKQPYLDIEKLEI